MTGALSIASGAGRTVCATGSVTRILELAFGPFDEADITRLQDDYARCEDHDDDA